MKSVTKTARLSSNRQSLTLQNILKQSAVKIPRAGKAKEDPAEYLVIGAKDIPAASRAKLMARGIPVNLSDNLLERLTKLTKENRHLKSLNITDELTGLYNKRFFNSQLNIEIARTRRTGEPFCLVFIDLDNFKMVNDTLGHDRGDDFLVNVCRKITGSVRPTDFACRFGGDEFAVILPATTLRDGITIARRWHKLILQAAAAIKLPVSSSIGIDEFEASSKLSAEDFLHRVDQYLYEAKRTGKGKIAHPTIEIRESKAVTWAEKEILFHIFQPSAQKKSIPKKTGEKK